MATLEDVKKQSLQYKCDHCKEIFPAADVKLVEPKDNFKIMTPGMRFIYVDKNKEIRAGSEQPTAAKGDKLLACPKCNMAHFFGFDSV